MNMTGPYYVWIVSSSLPKYWWQTDDKIFVEDSNKSCNYRQMDRAVKGHFDVTGQTISTDLDKKTISSYVSLGFQILGPERNHDHI